MFPILIRQLEKKLQHFEKKTAGFGHSDHIGWLTHSAHYKFILVILLSWKLTRSHITGLLSLMFILLNWKLTHSAIIGWLP